MEHIHAGTAGLRLRASQEFQTEQSGIEDYIYRGGNARKKEEVEEQEEREEVVIYSVTAAGNSWSNVCCNKSSFSPTRKWPQNATSAS